jgi:flavin reductase (DIM6/NTAB) family NADH-FMN oxidoreductase RutF
VVTTAVDEHRAGCLVGFHSPCGIEPPRYAVWISKANHTYRIGVFAERFAVHFLHRGDLDLAALFATTSGDDVDKFARCAWTAGPDGVPLLDGSTDRFVGRRLALLDAGADHVCVVLEPVSVDHAPSPAAGTSWLRAGDADGLTAGHPPDERHPPT